MVNIIRKQSKIFAESATNNGQFGSLQSGGGVLTNDPEVIQALPAYNEGWNSATSGGSSLPQLEEFQGLQFNFSYHNSYILQKGIPEYNNLTDYHIGDITREIGGSRLYKSITNNNIGNDLTDANNWQYQGNLDNLLRTDAFVGRNLIINGDFEIAQRGTSFVSVAANTYTLDRWRYSKFGSAVHNVSQDSDVPTVQQAGRYIPNSIVINCTTAQPSLNSGDFTIFDQQIEGYNFQAIAQKTFTISFWVKATKTGVYGVATSSAGLDRTFVSEITINASDTWEFKTITVSPSPSAGTWNYTNAIGLKLIFCLASGTDFHTTSGSWQSGAPFFTTANQVNACDAINNKFRLAGVQVEAGSAASDFEKRIFQQELTLCQRYFQKSYNFGVEPGSITPLGVDGAWAINVLDLYDFGFNNFTVRMRSQPTMASYNPSTGAIGRVRNQSTGGSYLSNIISVSEKGYQMQVISAIPNDAYVWHWIADAEI